MARKSKCDQYALIINTNGIKFAITRKEIRKIATITHQSEDEATLMLMSKIRNLLPAYPMDDGPLTKKQMAAIKKMVPQRVKATASLLEGH